MVFFWGGVLVMLSCASVYCCLEDTCWERADLLTLVCDVLLSVCYNVLSHWYPG